MPPFTCGTTTANVAITEQCIIVQEVNLHVYHYAGNNPVKLVDPTGMWEEGLEVVIDNNLGQDYVTGVNDCDIWVETVLNEAGIGMPDSWSSAASTTVATHMQEMQDSLQDAPNQGTNIVFQGSTHVLIIGLNEDGTVDVAHQGWNSSSDSNGNNWYSKKSQYNSLAAFEAAWGSNSILQYVPVGNAQSANQTTQQPMAGIGGFIRSVGGGGTFSRLTPHDGFGTIGFGMHGRWR
ncbi:MAG: hypothetical protein LBD52_07745 [Prevotellaceae bacterium]|nr:hypothetical protein [Prevotellaceae bacterium]